MPMRILVTGGAGFIGTRTVKKLISQNHETAILDDFNDFYDPEIKRENVKTSGTKVYEADLRSQSEVERTFADFKPEAVIHLAARAGVRPSLNQPGLYIDTNVTGTLHILEAMKTHEVERLVFASSSSVYGCNEKVPFAESDPILKTISPYAATKVAGEHLCSVYSHLHDLRIVSLRFFTVYGPAQRPDLAIHKFARLMTEGIEIPRFGDGSTRRDYTYIDDIVDGVEKALSYAGPNRHEVFNLGESDTVELRELISLLEKHLGVEAKIKSLPSQPGDVPLTYADITKAKSLLGYLPQTKIDEGIEKFVEWFRDYYSKQ
ncbi:MAG: NAD-dependent epimerase/dehydratase family protein [Verrucomicrobiota bacterium]